MTPPVGMSREISDGLYQVFTYLVYKMMSEMIVTFVASIVFSCITFFPIRLQGLWVAFWLFYYVTLCCGIGTHALGSRGGLPSYLHSLASRQATGTDASLTYGKTAGSWEKSHIRDERVLVLPSC